jgi:hypothetical protein
VDGLKRAGIERVDQLLTDALLNPELARTLLMKATPENRPFIAQRLGSQLGTLAASAGAQAAGDSQPRGRQVAAPARRSVPAISPPAFGSLVPGGALRP